MFPTSFVSSVLPPTIFPWATSSISSELDKEHLRYIESKIEARLQSRKGSVSFSRRNSNFFVYGSFLSKSSSSIANTPQSHPHRYQDVSLISPSATQQRCLSYPYLLTRFFRALSRGVSMNLYFRILDDTFQGRVQSGFDILLRKFCPQSRSYSVRTHAEFYSIQNTNADVKRCKTSKKAFPLS